MSYAIPGQRPRPALDAALADVEERMKAGRCEVCGRDEPMLRYGLVAFWDYDRQYMSPLYCPECAKARRK